MTTYKLTVETEIELIQCCVCAVAFGLTGKHYHTLTESKATFFCPNGHEQSFITSPLQRELEAAKQEIERQKTLAGYSASDREQLLRDLEAANRKLNACKGQVTKLKKAQEPTP